MATAEPMLGVGRCGVWFLELDLGDMAELICKGRVGGVCEVVDIG